MTPDSSTLAWRIPWIEEPGRLQSMGSLRVGHDWATSLSLFTFVHWRRKWRPAPVFLPGESRGRGSLVGCRLWGRTESDTTEATQHTYTHIADGQSCDSFRCIAKWMKLYIFPLSLFYNTKQSSICYTVGPCWLSILNIAVYVYVNPKLPSLSSFSFLPELFSLPLDQSV